ncbi:MAG: hypothetical protein AAFO07_11725, partial [Bacteroidota bacterium]
MSSKIVLNVCLSFFLPILLTAQKVTVSDEAGNPLSDVLIYNTALQFSTTTDQFGLAVLDELPDTILLTFSILSFEEKQLSLLELRRKPQVVLKTISEALNAILVIGRREDQLKDLPQQIETIGVEEIERYQSQTAADVLED